MKKLLFLLAVLMGLGITGCTDDTTWDTYAEWRKANQEWYNEQFYRTTDNGELYYTALSPKFSPSSGVLIHYLNDRSLTEGNLSPLQTSVTKTRYYLTNYLGEPIDSSYNLTDSAYSSVVGDMIDGWQVALNDMRVGDSAEIVIPYLMGYGVSGSTSGAVLPYSMLKFKVWLIDIPYYEVPDPSLYE